MIRVLIGSIAGAIATYVAGFIFWASPLRLIGFSTTGAQQQANLQLAFAQNLTGTGHYLIPDPSDQAGGALYAKGPIAAVDLNVHGFAGNDMAAMIGGFVHELVVVFLIGWTLLAIADRVVDFESRARLVIGFAVASALLITLSDPIFMHADWRYAIYAFVADTAMIVAGGLVIARWFLPRAVAAPSAQQL